MTEENVCQLIQGDHRLTVYEIVAGFGISYSKIHAVVTDDLGYQKIPTKCYHRLLTDEQRRWVFSGVSTAVDWNAFLQWIVPVNYGT